MHTISPTLRAHQRGNARLPHIRVIARAERWGVPLLPWQRLYRGDERDCPHALAITGAGVLIRARNDGGALTVSRVANPAMDSAFGAWAALGTVEAGAGIALAARGDEVLLLSVARGGEALVLRRSGDGGASWAGELLLVRESSAIGWVALAMRRADGNACAFYTVGATLKRVRRSTGRWVATGASWTRDSDVSTLTGVAALHDGADYRLIVSGRARSPRTKRVWSCLMGDGGFPENRWSGLNVIAESDASSAREFGGPAIFQASGSDQRACFAARDGGGETSSRVYTSHPPALTGGNPEGWSEPEPHEASSAHGLAVTTSGAGSVWASTTSGIWRAPLAGSIDVSARLVEASWRLAPFRTRARVVLDNVDGGLTSLAGEAAPSLAAGGTIEIAPGYRSGVGATAEYGLTVHAAIDRLTREAEGGSARVVLECSGHWERLAAWRAPQVWQSPAGERAREALFGRLCAKVGIRVSGSGGEGWSRERPAFAVGPGESGLSAARRLLDVASEAVISSGDHLAISVPGERSGEGYGAGGHPIARLVLGEGGQAVNWVRAQGPARAADAHDFASIYRDGPRLRVLRSLDATSDTRARRSAAAALDRGQREAGTGLLMAPFHTGQELFDVISVTDERLGLRGRPFRVVEVGLEYSRRPDRRPRYDSVLRLGEVA